jgi:hypothetical protein
MESIGDCIEYTLGPAALDFIKKERLAVGRTLARLLLDTLDLDSGRMSVFFPPGLSLDQLQEDFEGGVLPPPPESEWLHYVQDDGMKVTLTPVPEANSNLIAIALRHVRAKEEHLCIFEDPIRAPGQWASDAEARMLVFQDEVYHLVRKLSVDDGDPDRTLRDALRDARDAACQMIGALTSLPPENAITATQRELTLEQLQLMAERTVKLFAMAYDGEGYLIWHRAET